MATKIGFGFRYEGIFGSPYPQLSILRFSHLRHTIETPSVSVLHLQPEILPGPQSSTSAVTPSPHGLIVGLHSAMDILIEGECHPNAP